MQVTEQTKALASDVLRYWGGMPQSHDQGIWASDPGKIIIDTKMIGDKEMKVCNSSMCAAGTATFLSIPVSEFKRMVRGDSELSFEEKGQELLGLTDDEAGQFFYLSNESAVEGMRYIAAGDEAKFKKLINE